MSFLNSQTYCQATQPHTLIKAYQKVCLGQSTDRRKNNEGTIEQPTPSENTYREAFSAQKTIKPNQNGQLQNDFKDFFKSLQIIHLALMTGLIIFGLITFYFHYTGIEMEGGKEILHSTLSTIKFTYYYA